MKRNVVSILAGVVLLLSTGCKDEYPRAKNGQSSGAGEIHGESNLRIVIRWPGDDFASKQDLETRDRIRKRLMEKGVGRIVRAGTGMGWMDILVEVRDREAAISEIQEIMKDIDPAIKFTLESE